MKEILIDDSHISKSICQLLEKNDGNTPITAEAVFSEINKTLHKPGLSPQDVSYKYAPSDEIITSENLLELFARDLLYRFNRNEELSNYQLRFENGTITLERIIWEEDEPNQPTQYSIFPGREFIIVKQNTDKSILAKRFKQGGNNIEFREHWGYRVNSKPLSDDDKAIATELVGDKSFDDKVLSQFFRNGGSYGLVTPGYCYTLLQDGDNGFGYGLIFNYFQFDGKNFFPQNNYTISIISSRRMSMFAIEDAYRHARMSIDELIKKAPNIDWSEIKQQIAILKKHGMNVDRIPDFLKQEEKQEPETTSNVTERDAMEL